VFNVFNGKTKEPSFYKMALITKSIGLSLDALGKTEMKFWITDKERAKRANKTITRKMRMFAIGKAHVALAAMRAAAK